ncbi:MAG: A24 family peptidase [Caulobacteraceae bacterium]|nr:A24 family peptidase [Caulobacteraceae bacterium]
MISGRGPVVALAAVVGACLGSFSVTAALRWARDEPFVAGRSHCDACAAPLGFVETVPVWSYLRRGGCCAVCGAAIDPVHLVGEATGAVIAAMAFLVVPSVRAAPIVAIGLVLLAAAVVDAKTLRLPNALTLAVALLGVGLSASRSLTALAIGLTAALVAWVLMMAVGAGYRAVRGRTGLGFGDVKLVAALALWLGLLTPWAVALAAGGALVMSLIRGRSRQRIAFGPAIAAGGWLVGMIMEAGLWPTSAI